MAKIAQGQDCVLIAGCGWGKTLIYFLPLVLWPTDVMVIVTPLKALGDEQQRKLEELGISSVHLKQGNTVSENSLISGLAQ